MTTALYRRYRPDTFADVIGQEHVTGPLVAALDSGRINHAYLFSGPRGCGKTTSARIFARCLNCAEGPTGTPCGVCESCVELATGGPGSLDVVEMDAASHGGVDDARELRERAAFAPARDRYKVFIIDEAHMVTPQGFNALLKLVEEPPEHVKFVFATTEPEKVIGTIRSRTHHYPFRLVPPERLHSYLGELAAAEGVEVAQGVLPLVVRAGGGSVRDSLSVLDQLIAGAEGGVVGYERAVALLGFTHATLLDDATEALAARDAASLFRVVERVVESGHAPRRFVEDLLERLRDLIVVLAAGDHAAAVLPSVPADQLERMRTQAQHLGAATSSRAADLVNEALSEMAGATSPRLQLELLCARLLLPGAEDGSAGYGARLDRLEDAVATGRAAAPAAAPAGRTAPSPAVAPIVPPTLQTVPSVPPALATPPAVPAALRSQAPDGEQGPRPVDAAGGPAAPAGDRTQRPADGAGRAGSDGDRNRGPAAPDATPGVPAPGGEWPEAARPGTGATPRHEGRGEGSAPDRGPAGQDRPEAAQPGRPQAPTGEAPGRAPSARTPQQARPEQTGQPRAAAGGADASSRADASGGADVSGEAWPEAAQPGRRPEGQGGDAPVRPDGGLTAQPAAGPDWPEAAQPGRGQAPARAAAPGGPAPERSETGPGGRASAPPRGQGERGQGETGQQQGDPARPQPARPEPVGPPAAAPSGGADGLTAEEVRRRWDEVLATLSQFSRVTWARVQFNAQIVDLGNDTLTIGFDTEGQAEAFRTGSHIEVLQRALTETLGLRVKVTPTVTGAPRAEPSAGREPQGRRRPESAGDDAREGDPAPPTAPAAPAAGETPGRVDPGAPPWDVEPSVGRDRAAQRHAAQERADAAAAPGPAPESNEAPRPGSAPDGEVAPAAPAPRADSDAPPPVEPEAPPARVTAERPDSARPDSARQDSDRFDAVAPQATRPDPAPAEPAPAGGDWPEVAAVGGVRREAPAPAGDDWPEPARPGGRGAATSPAAVPASTAAPTTASAPAAAASMSTRAASRPTEASADPWGDDIPPAEPPSDYDDDPWSGPVPEDPADSPAPARGPSNAAPANAVPSNAAPSNAAPSNAAPSNAAPSDAPPWDVEPAAAPAEPGLSAAERLAAARARVQGARAPARAAERPQTPPSPSGGAASRLAAARAADPVAPGRSADDDIPDMSDPTLEDSGLTGVALVEKMLGGVVINEFHENEEGF